jgi:hypothetical protein
VPEKPSTVELARLLEATRFTAYHNDAMPMRFDRGPEVRSLRLREHVRDRLPIPVTLPRETYEEQLTPWTVCQVDACVARNGLIHCTPRIFAMRSPRGLLNPVFAEETRPSASAEARTQGRPHNAPTSKGPRGDRKRYKPF